MDADCENPSEDGIECGLLGKRHFLWKTCAPMGPGYCSLGGYPLKPIGSFIAALLAAGALSVYAFPVRINGLLNSTRSFSLDGKWYSLGKTSSGNSVLNEELRKLGIDTGRIPREPLDSGDCVLDILSEEQSRMRSRSFPLPSCLHVEDNMEMETGLGFLDITTGKISPNGRYARKELAAKGWTFVDIKEHATPVSIGTIRAGRETAIVFLEENEGDFLYVWQREK
ncbi:MAG: hypothetical protein WCF31_09350 [Candidatus Deferrimicrobiaceae bacterium]